jgi:hypothetical protein
MEVISLDPAQISANEQLHSLHPSAIIFILGSIATDAFQSVLQQANILLIGIDPETNRAMLWAGREVTGLSASALERAIDHNMEILADRLDEPGGERIMK